MKKITILFTFLLSSVCAPIPASKKPNIIYILADDLGYGDLSCYGQKHFETPNIDRLAKGGMKFTQHYSGSTVCAPSRCALMTGLHIGHAFIRGNTEVKPEGQGTLESGAYTMAEMFKDAGYTTGLVGKWGLGAPGSEGDPLKQGFDRFYGYNCQRHAHNYYPYYLWDDNQRIPLRGNYGLETEDYAPDFIQDEALEFIRANKDNPFFMFYAHIVPHAEMFAPEEYMEKYRGKFMPESSYKGTDGGKKFRKFTYGSQPEVHAAFAAMVNVLDDHVGQVVAELEKLGIADNTLIFFSSDNGPHTEGGHDPDYFDSNGPLRGHKRDLYEGGVRVPMIAYWPSVIKRGSTSDHLSAFWDMLPTFAEIAGGPVPHYIDGISILPTLLGKDKKQRKHDYLYWEFHEKGGRVAVRKEKWKAVRYGVAENPDGPLELYDLNNDIGEENNVADKYPEVVAEMNEIIKSARVNSENPRYNFPMRAQPGKIRSKSKTN